MALTEPVYPPLVMPDSVERETVTIWSKGVALDADLYRPRAAPTSTPGVVLCHGWGGSKLTCERYAALFAEAGMIALSFTQATWFGSGPHLRMRAQQPVSDAPGNESPEVHRVRDVVDPIDWLHNFRAAVDYLEGEPGVDRGRIGAWGTSFGGGVAMHSAANDRRIRALSVQVAYVAPLAGPQLAHANQRAIDSARGTYDPIANGFDVMPGLAGFTDFARWTQYDVLGQLDRLSVPTVMLDAGKEELFSIADHCGRAYEILKAKPGQIARYEVIPGIDHYGIYFDGYARSSQVAVDWFRDHL
jgi:dienelactone hydrolase